MVPEKKNHTQHAEHKYFSPQSFTLAICAGDNARYSATVLRVSLSAELLAEKQASIKACRLSPTEIQGQSISTVMIGTVSTETVFFLGNVWTSPTAVCRTHGGTKLDNTVSNTTTADAAVKWDFTFIVDSVTTSSDVATQPAGHFIPALTCSACGQATSSGSAQ